MPGRTLRREVPRDRLFAGIFCVNRRCTFCLPCRTSRVRIPSAASKKACICRPVSWRSRLVRLRRVGLTPDSPRPDRPPFQGIRAVCRPILVRPNRSPSAGLQKVGCSACCGRLARLLLQRHGPADGAIPAVAVLWGQSGFSPETARSTSARSATRRAMARRAVSFLARRRPRQRRGAHHGELVPRQSRGVIAEASLSIGKQTSARIWAGLQLVVQSRHEIFDDGGFRSGRRSRRRAPRYPREGASE
jgi:hypothetical protein